jgi:hypothetical protein
MKALGWPANEGLKGAERGSRESPTLYRWDLSVHLWAAIENLPEYFPSIPGYLTPGHDSDGDSIPDLEDPLPLDSDNNGIPDRIDPNLIGKVH